MTQKELETITYQRRIRAMTLAILKRCKDANIPNQYMKINEKEFRELLCQEYHENIEKFSSYIYNKANELFNYDFIIIDGGTEIGRMKCGFALLFRMIACDKNGKYESCKRLVHTLSNFYGRSDMNRNDYADTMSDYDILFLSEFDRKDVNVYLEAGSFMDEIFEIRMHNNKPTIISFQKSLNAKNDITKENIITENDCGKYLSILSANDINPKYNVLRIRTKI